MRSKTRVIAVAALVAVTAVPAGALRLSCAWNSCAGVSEASAAQVPFCSLPAGIKTQLAAGFRSGRSPDVLGVAGGRTVLGGTEGGRDITTAVPWPSTGSTPGTHVPVVFSGTGLESEGTTHGEIQLDQIAPTISDVLGFRRPHPDVRAGTSLFAVASGEVPRLVLEVAWKGVGSDDLSSHRRGWPFLRRLVHGGIGTLDGRTGSLPLDPTATLTTIGTGGPPSQHGMTGELVRNDQRKLVPAWGKGSPPSVIATLPDDYDHAMDERPLVGLVATSESDRGIIGRNWYPDDDADRIVIDPNVRAQTDAVASLLARGFGGDRVPDILAVVAQGPPARLDAQLRSIVALADRASGGSVLVVVAGTGSVNATASDSAAATTAGSLVREVDDRAGVGPSLVEGSVPGGLFLDQDVLTQAGITGQVAQRALSEIRAPDGSPLMADTFQGFAVSFGKYC